MSEPLLEVVGLSKRFPTRAGRGENPWIIRDLSMTVRDGEFVTIVGPSGGGKSTLLNLIAQIDAPTEGHVRLRDRNGGHANGKLHPGHHCQIGYVTQDDNLLPWRTTIDNVLFALEVQRRLSKETRARAHEMIEAVGLSGFTRYYPHELSGGMRKRASLIRTLVYDPPIILMDEPFGAVDAETRMQLQMDLMRLWEMGRKTIIFVTHDITEAIVLGDRTLILSRSPTRIASELEIPIPRPRDAGDAFALPGFADLHGAIRKRVR